MKEMLSTMKTKTTFSIEDVVEILKRETKTLPNDFNLLKANVTNIEGHLFEKIQFELDKTRSKNANIKIVQFNYLGSYEINDLTGSELLQFFVKLVNYDMSDGDAILLSSDKKYHAAILKYSSTQIEFRTLPLSILTDLDSRFIFTKLFDDSHVQDELKNKPELKPYLKPDKLKMLRDNSRQRFPRFLEQNMSQNMANMYPYQYAFMGLLFEIARTEIVSKEYFEARGILNDLPVAACIKLAMDTQQTGKLKKVFGERGQLTNHNNYNIIQQKADQRMDAAKEIILQSIPNKLGSFKKENVEEVLDGIKKLYSF
ncbi:unnamed protein product [Clavelina lepadiformis]|uniref:Uncharacterized protein n=1 Tax=Clavelina lepadiformis TaxID=159417 RepID=A0ABP0EYH5_CLALP